MTEDVIETTGQPSDATMGHHPDPEVEPVKGTDFATEDSHHGLTDSGAAMHNRRWALVIEGFVKKLMFSSHPHLHPFADEEMEDKTARAIDVSKTDCQVGYLADEKGNVSAQGTRKTALTVGQPAYHDFDTAPAPHTRDAALMYGLHGKPEGIGDREPGAMEGPDSMAETPDEDQKSHPDE